MRDRGLEAYTLEGGMKAWSMAWNTAEVSVAGTEAWVIQVRRSTRPESYLKTMPPSWRPGPTAALWARV